MEFKGTEGKWFINPKAQRNVRCDSVTVANTSQDQKGDNEKEEIYNALLISKAPEMLEMLENINEYLLADGSLKAHSYQEEVEKLIKEATEL